MHTVYYTSQDVAQDGEVLSSWSVYGELYAGPFEPEPLPGSQRWVSTHTDEKAAYREANRLQKLSQPTYF